MKFTNKISMQGMYYLLCIFIFLFTLLSFGTQLFTMRRMLFTNTEQLLQAAHQQSYDNINRYLNNLENVAISLGYNASVQRYLKETDPVKRLNLYPDVQTVFSGFSMSQNDVQGFAVYDKNGEFVVTNARNYQAIIQDDTISTSNRITYSSFYPSNPYIGITVPYYIMIIPVLDSNTVVLSDHRIGTIIFTMNQSYIKSQVDTGNQIKGCNMILIDESGYEIAGLSQVKHPIEDILSDDGFVVFDHSFSNNGWRLITFFEKGVIADNMIPLLSAVIITTALIVVMMIAFVILLSRQFISPIHHISHFMSEVSRNVSESIAKKITPYHLPKKWNYEELISMSGAMNGMLQSLDEKTAALLSKEKQYYEAVLARHRTEILAYRNQINPHFLYNTFECIKGIALSRNAPEIVEISQALSQMFRYVVKGSDFVTVQDELTHMQEYALIIHYRFMGRITIHIDANEAVTGYYMPRLILQPIVENAVFHGLEKKIGPGKIEVNISEENEFIHIKVSDDGMGMDSLSRSKAVQSLENQTNNNGIGLSNIAHRLSLFYSDNYDIRIFSTEGIGTTIELILPIRRENAENV